MNSQNIDQNLNYDKKSSLALDLETLSAKYKTLLTKYRQSVLDYIENLKEESSKPCAKYNANSKNISQACYEELWKKSGCTSTGIVNADNWWAKARTLNELIYDCWLWAVMTDDTHRNLCYNVNGNGNPYFLLGVSTNGRLFSCKGVTLWGVMNSDWTEVNDDLAYDLHCICCSNDGTTIVGTNRYGRLIYKNNWNDPKWLHVQNQPGWVWSVAVGQDGTLVGVGGDNKLWSKPGKNGKLDINGNWSQTANPDEIINSICIGPDGSIFCIGGNQIWKKNSYKNLSSQTWEFQGHNTCCVKAITIAPDGTFIGVGTDNQIYTKDNYKNLSTPWKGPYKNPYTNQKYGVVGVATFVNPSYNASKFNNSLDPNYYINAPKLTDIKGQAFWGTYGLKEGSVNNLQECSAMCSANSKCTGATFNPDKRYCWTRGGENTPIPALQNDYAIIPKSKQLLEISNSINKQINVINQKMQKKIDELYSIYGRQIAKRSSNDYSLVNDYERLNSERKKIEEIIKQYQTLEESQDESSVYIRSNYYLFFVFFLIVFIAVIILAFSAVDPAAGAATFAIINNASTNTKFILSNTNPYYIMFGIILLVTIAHLYNTYITSIYNNIPSFTKMGQMGIVYFVFFIIIIFIAISYFKRSY